MPTPTPSKAELDRGIQRFLNLVGKQFQEFLRAKINRKYPPASRVGEYPAKRTGSLRASVHHRLRPSKNSLVIGILRDVMLGGKTAGRTGKGAPTKYGAILEFGMARLLVSKAWEEFWPTIDHRMMVKVGANLSKELEFVLLTTDPKDERQTIELRGLEDVFDSRPTIMGRQIETERQEA